MKIMPEKEKQLGWLWSRKETLLNKWFLNIDKGEQNFRFYAHKRLDEQSETIIRLVI